MSKTVSFKNNDRFIQIGIAIVTLRKLRGMSQEKLAEKAGISRSLLSVIEAPGTAHNFTLDVFFDIADALEVDPADLISASMIPDKMLKGRETRNTAEYKMKGVSSDTPFINFYYVLRASVCVCRRASISIRPSSRSFHQYGRRNSSAFSSQT